MAVVNDAPVIEAANKNNLDRSMAEVFEAPVGDPETDLETFRSAAAVELAPMIEAEKETVTPPTPPGQSTKILFP